MPAPQALERERRARAVAARGGKKMGENWKKNDMEGQHVRFWASRVSKASKASEASKSK